jgi:hypothetical protein
LAVLLPGHEEDIEQFNCLAGSIHAFKERYGFPSRAFHYMHRPSVMPGSTEHWKRQIEELLEMVLANHLLNTDKTT